MTVFLFAVIASIVTLDPDTGRLSAFRHSFENRYLLMEKGKPDVTALERDDVVVKRGGRVIAILFTEDVE